MKLRQEGAAVQHLWGAQLRRSQPSTGEANAAVRRRVTPRAGGVSLGSREAQRTQTCEWGKHDSAMKKQTHRIVSMDAEECLIKLTVSV